MAKIIDAFLYLTLFVAWLAGAVLAKGWWKLLAFCLPPYSFYLIVERVMQAAGVIS